MIQPTPPPRRHRLKRAKAAKAGPERRSTCRYPALINSALMTWEERGVASELPVKIIDVSTHGCRLIARSRIDPKPDGPICLRVIHEVATSEIRGALLASTKAFLGPRTLRVRFLWPLSFRTFKLLVYGPEGMDLQEQDRPEHETDMLWR